MQIVVLSTWLQAFDITKEKKRRRKKKEKQRGRQNTKGICCFQTLDAEFSKDLFPDCFKLHKVLSKCLLISCLTPPVQLIVTQV